MKKAIILLSLSLLSLTTIAQGKCQAITKANKQCTRNAVANGYCKQHDSKATRCAGITKAGQPCKLLPSKGSKYCHIHSKI